MFHQTNLEFIEWEFNFSNINSKMSPTWFDTQLLKAATLSISRRKIQRWLSKMQSASLLNNALKKVETYTILKAETKRRLIKLKNNWKISFRK
jgi:hypothetical protein